MKRDQALSCARAQVLLEPYLDGVLSGRRCARMQQHLASCPSCRDELVMARTIQEELRALPKLLCPDVVVDTVLSQVAAARPRSAWSRWREAWSQAFGMPIWRPVGAVVGAAAVALVITLMSHQPLQNGYTPQELARAEVEARYAFAIVAQVTTRASDFALENVLGHVVRDVMGNQVIEPITDAVQKPFVTPPGGKENS